ncbi:MAG: YceI family protein [Bacteroidales bacterium]|nr:YceI family protein [Bacteroidales bacterium]MBN2750497.1 YceI family protein [Bacteroidales bacterium]
MRKLQVVAAVSALLLVTLVACNGPKGEKVDSTNASAVSTTAGQEVMVDLSKTLVYWEGAKPTGLHNGTVSLYNGFVRVNEGALVGGEFTMDMKSIKVLDLTDEKMNKMLVDHLLSPDFFLVDSFPTATFVITKVIPLNPVTENANVTIEGNLTLRGVTKGIAFPAMVTMNGAILEAKTPQFVVNRVDWGVNYGSKSVIANLKDNFINDEMGLRIELITK